MQLDIDGRIFTADFVAAFDGAVNVDVLMRRRKCIILYEGRRPENDRFELRRRCFIMIAVRFYQAFQAFDQMQFLNIGSLIVGHEYKEIIARPTDCHVENIELVEEKFFAVGNERRRVEHNKNDIAFVALEAVNRADLNIDSRRQMHRRG